MLIAMNIGKDSKKLLDLPSLGYPPIT